MRVAAADPAVDPAVLASAVDPAVLASAVLAAAAAAAVALLRCVWERGVRGRDDGV